MKQTNALPFISLLLIAAMALAPIIVADQYTDPGYWDGPGATTDPGNWDGPGATTDPGYWNGAGAGTDPGNWDPGTTTDSGTTTTTTTTGGSTFDTGPGSFDNGPGSFNPFPGGPTPGGPGGFPTNADAKWKPLEDKTIKQASRDGTLVYENIFSQCTDPDNSTLTFKVASTSSSYELRFVDDDLKIFKLNPYFTGTEKVTLKCNNIPASFKLTVAPLTGTRSTDDSDNDEDLSIHLGAIIIPNAYDAQAGDTIPVTISFKNNGDKKLENLKAAVVIQDLGIRASVGPLDLPVGRKTSKTMYVQLPEDVQPGTYYVRITIDSGSLHRAVHRDIEVIV